MLSKANTLGDRALGELCSQELKINMLHKHISVTAETEQVHVSRCYLMYEESQVEGIQRMSFVFAGSKDDLHANGCVVPDDSISKTDCDETASFDNGFHDESRETAARIDGVRSKIGILKHSKTSASLDLHKEHLPVSEHWADCYRALSNTMPTKTVAFCEQQLPKQKWDFTADTSEAMDRLRAITSHLCLPVILGNQSDGLKEHHSHQKASQLWRFKHIGADKDAPLADDPQQNLTLTFQDMNEFITGIEQELVSYAMRHY